MSLEKQIPEIISALGMALTANETTVELDRIAKEFGELEARMLATTRSLRNVAKSSDDLSKKLQSLSSQAGSVKSLNAKLGECLSSLPSQYDVEQGRREDKK